MTIEKMKQGLETLEEAVHYTSAPVWSPSMTKECNEAIASLRQAIAEAEGQEKALQALHAENEKLGLYKDAYAEQEPVAWHEPSAYGNVTTHKDWALANGWKPLYTRPQPKRTWVGLTDEDLEPLCNDWQIVFNNWAYEFVKAIEAKLKQKNQ